MLFVDPLVLRVAGAIGTMLLIAAYMTNRDRDGGTEP